MKIFLSLLIAVLSFCRPAVATAQAPELSYTFDLRDPSRIHVSLQFPAHHPGTQLLLLPSQWAGQTELYRAISSLATASPGATLSPTHNPSRWLLQARHPGPITITYELSEDWSGPLRHPFEHRAILSPHLFEFTGENGLVAPNIPGDDPVEVSFTWSNLPASQTLVTSFGSDTHQHFAGRWSDVRNALFTGGEFNAVPLTIEGRPVLLALHGQWDFPIERFAGAARSILASERELWHDTAIPFYAIVIAPYDDPNSGGGGSGFTNISNLFLSDRASFTEDTASLLAHEAFHEWSPTGLGSVRDTEQIAWFGEGFTRFYQDAVLERAGLLTEAGYLARLNTTIRDYLLSPEIHATNAELQQMPASDLFAYQEPYLRGAVIALWLSSEIDRQSSGRHTLTDLMLALRAERSEPLTADRIFRTAGRFVDPPTVAQLRAFALHGDSVPISTISLGQCVAFSDQPAWTFDLGFDPASLHRSGIVHGVQQGSNAWQAGVRDGQQLGGFSLWNGNPEREVTLTLRETDGKRERLTFLPRGKLLDIPQAQEVLGCSEPPRIPR